MLTRRRLKEIQQQLRTGNAESEAPRLLVRGEGRERCAAVQRLATLAPPPRATAGPTAAAAPADARIAQHAGWTQDPAAQAAPVGGGGRRQGCTRRWRPGGRCSWLRVPARRPRGYEAVQRKPAVRAGRQPHGAAPGDAAGTGGAQQSAPLPRGFRARTARRRAPGRVRRAAPRPRVRR